MANLITIQDLDSHLRSWLEERARQLGIGVEDLILQLIHDAATKQAASPSKSPTTLERLAGTWTPQEASSFLQTVEDFERIDDRIWK
jgi:hypothetical protein